MVSVKVTGVEATAARFLRLADRTNQRLGRALDKAAALVEREAVKRIPVDTGQSQAQIYVRSDGKLSRFVGSDTRQALFAEYSPLMLKGGTPENPRKGPWPYQRRIANTREITSSFTIGNATRLITKGRKATATMPWLRPSLLTQKQEILNLIREAVSKD